MGCYWISKVDFVFEIDGTKVSGMVEFRQGNSYSLNDGNYSVSGSIDDTGKFEAKSFVNSRSFSIVGTAKGSVISGKWTRATCGDNFTATLTGT